MGDLKNPKWMYLKFFLFVVIIIACAAGLYALSPSWQTVGLVALLIWASARAYYFMFYVIEKYIDSDYKFSGVISFVRYVLQKDSND